jgi:hypothetical protein
MVTGRPREFQVPSLQTPLDATFGTAVTLLGVDVTGDLQADPGGSITLPLLWRVVDAPGADLVRFVHLVQSGGHPVAQQDTVPCAGECPSATWLRNEVLTDEAEVVLPTDLAPGHYSLAVGWYDAATLQRLPVMDSNGQRQQNDLLILPLNVVVAP